MSGRLMRRESPLLRHLKLQGELAKRSRQTLRRVLGDGAAASPSAASPSATASAGCVTIAGGASGAGLTVLTAEAIVAGRRV